MKYCNNTGLTIAFRTCTRPANPQYVSEFVLNMHALTIYLQIESFLNVISNRCPGSGINSKNKRFLKKARLSGLKQTLRSRINAWIYVIRSGGTHAQTHRTAYILKKK